MGAPSSAPASFTLPLWAASCGQARGLSPVPTGSQNMEENPAPSGRRPDAGVGWGAALGPRPPPPAACSPGGPRLRRRPCDPAGPEGAAQHRSRPDTAWAPERARLARTQGPQPECTARPPNELGLGASAPASASRLTRRRALRCWATLQWGRRSPRGPPRTPQHARPPVPRTWRGCRPQAAPRDPSAGPPLGAASQSLQTGGPVPHGPVGAGAERGERDKGDSRVGEKQKNALQSPRPDPDHTERRGPTGSEQVSSGRGAGGSVWGQTLPEGLLSPRCTPRMACKAGPVPSGRHGHCGGRHSGRPPQNHWLARQVLVLSASPGPTPLRPMPRPELWPQFLLHVGV